MPFKDTPEGQTNYCTHVISQEDGYCHRCFGKDLEASSIMPQQEDWKDSYKGKLWSTAVQKCFEAPFVEVAIQHLLQKIDEKHQAELKSEREKVLNDIYSMKYLVRIEDETYEVVPDVSIEEYAKEKEIFITSLK